MVDQIQFQQAKPVRYLQELEMVRIKKIGVLSTANVLALIHLFIGIILAVVFIIFYLINRSVEINISNPEIEGFVTSFGIFLAFLIPVVLAIAGFVLGMIIALLYNLSAKISKGIKLYS